MQPGHGAIPNCGLARSQEKAAPRANDANRYGPFKRSRTGYGSATIESMAGALMAETENHPGT